MELIVQTVHMKKFLGNKLSYTIYSNISQATNFNTDATSSLLNYPLFAFYTQG